VSIYVLKLEEPVVWSSVLKLFDALSEWFEEQDIDFIVQGFLLCP
jgi:hypothetical protein